MKNVLNLLAEHRLQLTPEQSLAELRADIVRAAYVEGDFTLTGGLRRNYYVDKYLFATRPAILRRLGRFLGALVPPNTDRLAAPVQGAVALGTAVSLELGLPFVIVHPAEDEHTPHTIEGELYPDEDVVLIEDVVVTGKRALDAVRLLAQAGARVTDVVAVLDRREGAAQTLTEASINYRYLFVPEDLGIGE